MREIKFRAWDTEERRWVHSNLMFDCQGLKYWGFGYSDPMPIEEKERYILMQYTGLKDKNDKEIYEGDRVRIANQRTGQVFERLGCWFVELGKELGYYPTQDIEIIGNIYENPGLLSE